jgi:hypothetical protein
MKPKQIPRHINQRTNEDAIAKIQSEHSGTADPAFTGDAQVK